MLDGHFADVLLPIFNNGYGRLDKLKIAGAPSLPFGRRASQKVLIHIAKRSLKPTLLTV